MSKTTEQNSLLAVQEQDQQNLKGEHLYALLLKLRARTAGTLSLYAGQLAHAALLHWFAQVDEQFSTRLHTPNARRPFTCSSLLVSHMGETLRASSYTKGQISIQSDCTYYLRFTLLTEKLFQPFMMRYFLATTPSLTGIENGLKLPTLRLGGIQFEVVDITVAPSQNQQDKIGRWSGHTTYKDLVEQAGKLDMKKGEVSKIALEFCSPTAFSNGQHAGGKLLYLFPDTERIFDNLSRTWNMWAPDCFRLDTLALLAYIREQVAITSYNLHTHTVRFDRMVQEGFMGKCVYALLESRNSNNNEPSRYANVGTNITPMQTLAFLSHFAFYAGVGYKTTMGMGQACWAV